MDTRCQQELVVSLTPLQGAPSNTSAVVDFLLVVANGEIGKEVPYRGLWGETLQTSRRHPETRVSTCECRLNDVMVRR